MRSFKIETCPFEEGDQLYTKDEIEIKSGLTVLVGCNGSGKTSLLQFIRDDLKDNDEVEVLYYDNLRDGGSNAKEAAGWWGNTDLLANLICSSEGEQIIINIGQTARKIGGFVKKYSSEVKELWILFDAVDSGLSIDNIVDIKEDLFSAILEDFETRSSDLYIIVVANSYEMCNGEDCFDVTNGEYIRFQSYSDYKDFILNSKKYKDSRYDNS